MTAKNATETVTANLLAKQREYIWPCAATYYEHPLALERGEGMHVWDSEGNRYLDCFGGVLTTSVGHARPEVVNAVSEQIGKIAHTSTLYINQPQTDLAEKVASITPGNLKKSFFTNSGTEADETAMVLSRIYTGRTEIRVASRLSRTFALPQAGTRPGNTDLRFLAVHAHAPYRIAVRSTRPNVRNSAPVPKSSYKPRRPERRGVYRRADHGARFITHQRTTSRS
jgi:hypothetical protein